MSYGEAETAQIGGYRPRDNEFVLTMTPDLPNAEPELTLIIKKATREQKQEFLEKMQTRLALESSSYEILPSEEWLESDDIYMAIDLKDQITLVSAEFILGPYKEE
jgi:hypothetical protein